MALKKTLQNLIIENGAILVECPNKEEATSSLIKIYKVGKNIPGINWPNEHLKQTLNFFNDYSGPEIKRIFILIKRTGSTSRMIEIYIDKEVDTLNSEGEISRYSRVKEKVLSRYDLRKIYSSKDIKKILEGTREEESTNINNSKEIQTNPPETIPEEERLMEQVEEGRITGRRRERDHLIRERDRANQRRRDAERGILRESYPVRATPEERIPEEHSIQIIGSGQPEEPGRRGTGDEFMARVYYDAMIRGRGLGGIQRGI